MHRMLERFSAFASTAVVFVYLGGLFLGTSAYFVGHAFSLSTDWALTTGIALALAVEVHSYLSQRSTRANWQTLHKLDSATPAYEAAQTQFRVHLGITCGLVAFSMFNSIAFWALVQHPLGAGDWAQVVVRGMFVPAAFLAAGFLVPLTHDASAVLANAEHAMLRKTVKTITKQQSRRVERMRQQGINLAPLGVRLLENASEHPAATRLDIINRALDEAEGLDNPSQQLHNSGQPLPARQLPPITPWTDRAWSHPSGPFEYQDYSAQGEEQEEQAEAMPARIAVARAKPSKPRRSGNTAPKRTAAENERLARKIMRDLGHMPSGPELIAKGMGSNSASFYSRLLRKEAEQLEQVEA